MVQVRFGYTSVQFERLVFGSDSVQVQEQFKIGSRFDFFACFYSTFQRYLLHFFFFVHCKFFMNKYCYKFSLNKKIKTSSTEV